MATRQRRRAVEEWSSSPPLRPVAAVVRGVHPFTARAGGLPRTGGRVTCRDGHAPPVYGRPAPRGPCLVRPAQRTVRTLPCPWRTLTAGPFHLEHQGEPDAHSNPARRPCGGRPSRPSLV